MMNKYKGMQAKMEGVKIQMANITSTQTLVDTMRGMSAMMSKSAEGVNINNIQQVMTEFTMSMEKQQVMGEMVEDAAAMDEMDVEDEDADALIDQLGSGGGQGGQALTNPEVDLDAQLGNLKI